MKFPLPRNVFPTLEVPSSEAHEYEALAQELVQQQLREYERFVRLQRRQVNPSKWKSIKKRGQLAVYKEITGSKDSSSSIPTVLATGSIAGTLDDVLYGIVAPDASSMRLKSSYLHDDVADGAVLSQLHGPTTAEPFRFLGLKWIVKQQKHSSLVRPRDFVVLEATGTIKYASNPNTTVTMGFHLMHSIDNIKGCRDLTDRGIVRGRLSTCYLFQQLADHTVDLYVKSSLDPRGRMIESMAIQSAIDGIVSGCWNASICAQSKKLSYLLQHQATNRSLGRRQSMPLMQENRQTQARARSTTITSSCGRCQKSFGAFSSRHNCQLCHLNVCGRCRLNRQLSYESIDGRVLQTSMVFCQDCVTNVNRASAVELAKRALVRTQVRRERARSRAQTFMTQQPRSLLNGTAFGRGLAATLLASSSAEKMIPERRSSVENPANEASEPPLRLQKRLSSCDRTTMRTTTSTLAELDGLEEQSSPTPPPMLNDPVCNQLMKAMDYVGHYERNEEDEDETSSLYTDMSERSSLCSSIAVMEYESEELLETSTPVYSGPTDQIAEEEEEEEEDQDEQQEEKQQVHETQEQALILAPSNHEWEFPSYHPSPLSSPAPRRKTNSDLYTQISELRNAAENIYQFTKRNTETVLRSSQKMRFQDDCDLDALFPEHQGREERAYSYGATPVQPFRFEELD